MQPLHHLTVERDRTARGILRPLECRDDLAGVGDLLLGRGEDGVAGLDLAWMNQRLAVESKIARLGALLPKAVEIAEIAVGSVEDFEAVSAGGQNAVRDHRQHRGAARLHPYPSLARNIVGPEHEAGQPRVDIA